MWWYSGQAYFRLVENDNILTQDAGKADILNTFSSNAFKDLKIPEFEEVGPFSSKNITSNIEINFQIL